jgi:hypothetical protein
VHRTSPRERFSRQRIARCKAAGAAEDLGESEARLGGLAARAR